METAEPTTSAFDRRSLLTGGLTLGALGAGSLLTAAPAAAGVTRMYNSLDVSRVRAGRRKLYRATSLARVAQAWAAELARSGSLRHNPRYSSQIPSGWMSAAENVGYVGAGHSRPEDVLHSMWMNSSGHRANMLGNFSSVGIGRVVDSRGRLWGVQVFGRYS
ncbi:CAP domain-containing protein [Jannaschia sp. R86511]|uniref:CAP domain-containing protein n=1 Tax=Jannaschia sp. R86511 TaxID=3093853 RepID=UPI0036D43918